MVHSVVGRLLFAALLLSVVAVALSSAAPAVAEQCGRHVCVAVDVENHAPLPAETDPCLFEVTCGGGGSLQSHAWHGCGGALAAAPAAGNGLVRLACGLLPPTAGPTWNAVAVVGGVERPPRWVS